jgi:TadE-like protein
MSAVLRSRGRARRRSRGAAAVEAALILPLLIMLVFAILEFGFLFKDWLAVTSSVRAGARIASAEPRLATFATDAAAQVAKEGAALGFDANTVLWVYEADTDGYPIGDPNNFSVCPSTSCIKYKWSAGGFVLQSGSWPALNQNACQGDAGHDSVGIFLSVKDQAITKMFFDSMTLKSRTVMSLEPIPATNLSTNGCKP